MAKTILQMTAQQTADWLSGADTTPWTHYLNDPELQRRIDETKFAIRQRIGEARRMGLDPNSPAQLRKIAELLLDVPGSPQTSAELRDLIPACTAANELGYSMLRMKLVDLVEFAYSDA